MKIWIEGTSRIYLGATIAQNAKSKLEKAGESINEGIKILDGRKIKPWSSIGYYNLGMLQADCGQLEEALGNLKKAEKMFIEMGMDYWTTRAQETLERL